jgi:5-methyltetrahydrofolate--homocysteine methyltransferase
MTDVNDFRTRLVSGTIIVFDGSMGIELARRGLSPGPNWNDERPDVVLAIHKDYREAGADVLITNTLVANRVYLTRAGHPDKVALYNRRGVELARKAGAAFVAGDVSSTGELLEPFGALTPTKAYDAFCEQATLLHEAGVDLFIIETMIDPKELALAAAAIKDISDKPLIASMAFDEARGDYRTPMGTTVKEAADSMAQSGADAVGINCGSLNLDDIRKIVVELRRLTDLPVIAQPNAGKPSLEGGTVKYNLGAEEFAKGMLGVIEAGATLVGGCCGTTPEHIRALTRALQGR